MAPALLYTSVHMRAWLVEQAQCDLEGSLLPLRKQEKLDLDIDEGAFH